MVKILSISKKINYTEYKTDDFLTADKVNEIQQCIQADESAIEEIEGKIQQTTSYSKDEIDDKLSKKVDVVDGKNLSTNDYTNEDKAEVEKIKDKQDKLIFDDIPTKDSTNAITSGAVEAAITAANTGYTKQEVDSKLDEKVDKITGKDLSTNDYTNDDKAEVAKIKDKQNKLIYDEVPTADSTNSLTSGAIYSAIDNINTNLTTEIEKKVNKATTIEGYGIIDAYTKSEIDSKIVGVYKICGSKTVEEINAIEASTLTIGDVYNVSDSGVISTNIKVNAGDNVVWTEDGWDNLVGIVDLSSYQEKLTFDDTPTTDSENPVKSNGIATELNKKVDKITGKVLSTNDYTNDDKAEVAKIKDKQNKLIYDEVPTADSTNSVTSGVIYKTVNGLAESFNEVIETKVDKEENKGLSTNDYTNEEKAEVAKIKDKQDTLIFDDEPMENSENPVKSKGILTAINNLITDITNKLLKKVDVIEGKQLSTNDYTDDDKAEVDKVKNKQDKLIFDNTPTTDSNNSLTSGVVKKSLDDLSTTINENIDKKVDKEENKGLSTNDYTNEEKAEVAKVKDKQDILTFDDVPTVDSNNPVKSSGIKTAINDIKIELSTEIDKKATKATTIEGYGITDAYTKSEVDSKIVGVYKICGSKTVEEISTIDISTLIVGDVYNISNSGIVGTDVKVNAGDNIVWTEDGWDNLSGIVDLSNYQEKLTFDIEPTEDSENMVKSGAIYAALRKKVDKSEENKGLSTNDYTNEEKAEVAKIKDKQDTLIFDDEPMENSENPVKSKGILTAINNLITDITNKLLKKVDVIEGKQLSTNDYTDDDKAEVAKIKDKQDTLVFDETPTKDSTNVITSGAVAKALEGSGGTSLAISGEGANSVVINNADTNTNSVKGAGSISIGNANTILSSNARAFGGNIWIGQAGYLVMGRKSNNVFYLTDVSAFSTGTMVLVYTYFTQGGFFNSPIVDEVTAVDTTNKTITLKNTTTLTAQKDYICKCGEKKDGDQIFGGKNATAEGNSNFVSGNAAHAEGSETAAYGYYSHSEGVSTKAYGQASHVENSNTKAYGNYSHAEGMYTTANGSAAHSEGTSTKANGTNSHAEGNGSVAEGEMSHAQNQSTIANGNSQTAIGKFNIADTTNLFIIGKGTSDSARANALTVNQDGSLWVSGNLRIGGESFSGVGDDGRVLTFGTDDSYYDWRFKKLEARLKALDNQDPDYSRQAKRDEDFDNL